MRALRGEERELRGGRVVWLVGADTRGPTRQEKKQRDALRQHQDGEEEEGRMPGIGEEEEEDEEALKGLGIENLREVRKRSSEVLFDVSEEQEEEEGEEEKEKEEKRRTTSATCSRAEELNRRLRKCPLSESGLSGQLDVKERGGAASPTKTTEAKRERGGGGGTGNAPPHPRETAGVRKTGRPPSPLRRRFAGRGGGGRGGGGERGHDDDDVDAPARPWRRQPGRREEGGGG